MNLKRNIAAELDKILIGLEIKNKVTNNCILQREYNMGRNKRYFK